MVTDLTPLHNLLCSEWQQGDIAGPFYSPCHLSLMFCTVPGNPPREYLAPFGHKTPQSPYILVIREVNLLFAELAHLSSSKFSYHIAPLGKLTS